MPAKKSKKKKKSTKTASNVLRFLRSERGQFLMGVCVIFIALFMFIGMISFFFTGAADQSKVANKYFLDLIIHKQDISNWTGVGGAFIAEALINKYCGVFSLVIPVFIGMIGVRLIGIKTISVIRAFILCSFILIWGSIFSSFILTKVFPDSHIIWGGSHGSILEQLLETALGGIGVSLIIILLLVVFVIITKQTSVGFFKNLFPGSNGIPKSDAINEDDFEDEEAEEDNEIIEKNSVLNKIFNWFRRKKKEEDVSEDNLEEDNLLPINNDLQRELSSPVYTPPAQNKPILNRQSRSIDVEDDFEVVIPQEEAYQEKRNIISPIRPILPREEREELTASDVEEMEDYDPTKDLSNFHFPSSDLLKVYDNTGKGVDMAEQKANKDKIINTLRNYGIEITSIKATVGPTITLYEIVPQAGVRISKIRNLEDDIALSLSALGIRIIAPMPGKGTIGIEVPNKDPQIVSMQSVIASKRFQECNYDLPVALGKTITNEIFMFDLCKMPHLLVAGATGQGKSVGLNAIITSLLYKKHPAEMKMVLVDPKMVEFNIYSTIEKHYLAKLPDAEKAIITDVSKVTQTLNSLTKEMDDRYELLMAASVRTIKEYNEKFRKRRLSPLKGHRFLPYIVVIIDEFGDLIMTAGKEIEMPIARIAQKARAVGMHMIIATQRPTTNIITGTIKANFPARMAFRVTSQIDSRTILDMSGANQLIGRGDMLFSQGSDLVRIQCAFVDTPEVEEITQYIGKQQGYANAFELPEFVGDGGGDDKTGSVDLSDKDPLFEEAARLIVVHQQGSTSLIQRKFSIGYNRAGRLMDQLEAAGIVGGTQGSKPREVLIMDEYSLEQKLSSI
ncbi:S-DNA-T family DNA segregation ATPase FtsK/SpoIIIE [Dysgonomonas alginatilytica]|uniref:S-DNA-T family DNA segregation ATPase FtsK/SpoIIIE n=1 Tax=Dysgonomonas alginatilytica TaxID=1605892 RepID=A0A2V3PX56_9BACT|nr:DNA translocase FtsK [Dysgonomonas alginatilytica]PXV65425.1 S-DNA-T family DNA segregation ATPase FtsK/SpoIIIE [Dysgonomonas alginatilytica]